MRGVSKALALGVIAGILFISSGAVVAAQVIKPGGGLIKPDEISPKPPVIQPTTQNTKPNAPSNLTAESNDVGRVVLRWIDNSNNEEGFRIESKYRVDDTYIQVDKVGANETTYEQSELSTYPVHPGDSYYYRVTAYNSSGSSGPSNEVYIEIKGHKPSPAAPEALRAKAVMSEGRLTVRLFWADKSDNEEKFVVQRSKAGGLYTNVAELPPNSFKFEEPADLERNVKYTYRVMACNSGGASLSNTADVILPVGLPAHPSFNYIQSQGSTFMLLTWNDNSNNEDGFIITRWGDKPSNPFTGVRPPDKEYLLDPNVTSLLVNDLTPKREYSFEIVAYNAMGKSIASSVSGYTGSAPPVLLAATAEPPNQVKVSWNWSGDSVQGFSLERKRAGEAYAQIAVTGADARSFTDVPLLPGNTYYYRARSWFKVFLTGQICYSDYSNEIGITTPALATNLYTNNANPGHLLQNPVISGKKVIRLNLGQKSYSVNGQNLTMDTAPVSREGRTMLPIKYVTDSLGATLAWDGSTRKVTITQGATIIELWIGQNTARINGAERLIDPTNPNVRPFIAPPGRTMLPLRFISESLGCTVNWNAELQEASIEY